MSDYPKLNKFQEYDKEAVDQLVEALNEINQLEKRIRSIKELVRDNSDLNPFVWQIASGEYVALYKVDDNHLENIVKHLQNSGRSVSRAIREEARKRGIDVSGDSHCALIDSCLDYDCDDEDDEDDEYVNLFR